MREVNRPASRPTPTRQSAAVVSEETPVSRISAPLLIEVIVSPFEIRYCRVGLLSLHTVQERPDGEHLCESAFQADILRGPSQETAALLGQPSWRLRWSRRTTPDRVLPPSWSRVVSMSDISARSTGRSTGSGRDRRPNASDTHYSATRLPTVQVHSRFAPHSLASTQFNPASSTERESLQ